MQTHATREGAIMTDFQFKALMSMVLSIIRKSKDLKEVEREIQALADGKLGGGSEESE
jgi:hypothetical protein